MTTVAGRMRREQRERIHRMTAEERLREALALGEDAVAAYAAAHDVERQEARRQFERASQKGRRVSRVMAAAIG